MKEINDALLQSFRAKVAADPSVSVLNSALAKTDLADLSFVPMAAARHRGPFAVEVKTRGITAQQKSGRCWLFAALNILREIVAEKCGLEEFELSQNYLSFYDKLEKANNFLEMVIEQAGEPVKGQSMQYVLRGMVDGGYWSEAAHLAAKYGVVPKTVHPESYQSDHTDRFLAAMNRLLRKDAMELRDLVAAGKDPYPRKKEMLAEVYKAECIAFGAPVETFDFAWRDKDKNYHCDRNLTPKAFYDKYVGLALEDYYPVINEPTPDKEMDTPVAFHAVENMVGKDMEALNLAQEALEDLCIRQLQAGEPVWFACDAGACGARKEGIWDPDSVQVEKLLGGISWEMPKGKRLEYGASSATHAMLLTGVDFDGNGRPTRWKIENSWGSEVGEKGYFVCSEKYFKEYVYEAVIKKAHFTPEQREMLKKEPIRINPWEEDV
ncbi:MAG: C1 family peptidase [Acidaminococcus fermentans]|uniref:aminopeptidase C n=1 Tax=Acidaminococcus fermentans TaxID=905 RepID=UPI0024317525|nr:C1 family peptidase [Acidaminococcus fermentans]MDD7194916.1 C1 family peptidase [Acidaminococcus fermentans]